MISEQLKANGTSILNYYMGRKYSWEAREKNVGWWSERVIFKKKGVVVMAVLVA